MIQVTTTNADSTNWPSLSEAPPAVATSPPPGTLKPKISKSDSVTSSDVNGSKSGNDSSHEQPNVKENIKNKNNANKKKKGKMALYKIEKHIY